MENKLINFERILKTVFAIIIVIILYLFVLNGRYEYMTGEAVLDKWKKEVIRAGTDELPVKYNGESVKQK